MRVIRTGIAIIMLDVSVVLLFFTQSIRGIRIGIDLIVVLFALFVYTQSMRVIRTGIAVIIS